MSKRTILSLLSVGVFALAFSISSWGQALASGSIEGVVTDASGAVVGGSTVTAKNIANGTSFTAASTNEGLFRFPVVPVGTYEITISKNGFATVRQPEVDVAVGGKVDLKYTLQVAATAETVTVNSEPPVVETTRTQVSSNVNERAIQELPVNGRNFIDFVLLTPGVTRDVRTGDISFAGQRGTLNSLTVDGADNNNTFFGQTTGRTGSGRAPYQFSEDSVQEFQVNSNSYSAELGKAGGAVINVVTKSGTNKFHGAGFEYYRDQSMNAEDQVLKQNAFLQHKAIPVKPKYHFNQFGGDIGGPIAKDKLFFFFNYDGQRNTQPNIVIYNPPVIASPTTNQTTALNYLAARSATFPRGLNQDTYLTKIDWNLNQKNIISGRWNRQSFQGLNFENGGDTNSAEHTGSSNVHTDTVTVSATSTLSPMWLNVARFTYLRDSEPGLANSLNPEAVVRQGGQTILTVGRNSFSPRETTITREEYSDTLTAVQGRHTHKFGGNVIHDSILNFFPGNFFGAYTFNSLEDFGASLNGQVPVGSVTYAQAFAGAGTTGPTTHPDLTDLGFFFQEDWRVRNNLTFNFGMRYDRQSVKQPSVQNPAAEAIGFDTARIPTDNGDIAPRFGFAWNPHNDGKLVIRGGYGIFFGRTPSIMYGTAHSNNGINVGTITFLNAAAPLYPNTICGAPTENPSCAPPTGASPPTPSIYVFASNYQQPRVMQGNFGFEYDLGHNMSLSMTGLWVKGDHLQRTRDVNLGTPVSTNIGIAGTSTVLSYLRYPGTGTGANAQIRPNTAFARIAQFESTARSEYDGLAVEFKKRFSNHFQGSVSYTWSHVLDNAPDATSVVPFSSGDDAKMVSDPFNVEADYASGVNDVRHRFVGSVVWDLGYAHDLPRFANAIVGGWQLSTIVSVNTGYPYTPLLASDLNNDSNRQTDRLPGAARDSFRMPTFVSLDPRISKSFNIGENFRTQFFMEAFNALNRFNVTSVRSQAYAVSTSAAACTGTTNPCLVPQDAAHVAPQLVFGLPAAPFNTNARVLQLGAKITF